MIIVRAFTGKLNATYDVILTFTHLQFCTPKQKTVSKL